MLKYYLLTLLISMVPLVELRGALPFALGFGVPTLHAYILCIIGNMIPIPFIYLFARRFLEWAKDFPIIGNFCRFCLTKGEKAGEKLKEGGNGVYIALMLFVGIPLPGTGAWTGMLAASFLDMGFKKSTIAVLSGVLLAGVIVGAVAAGAFKVFGL